MSLSYGEAAFDYWSSLVVLGCGLTYAIGTWLAWPTLSARAAQLTRLRAALLLAGLLPMTSGCVAAMMPLYAGAALVKTQTGRGDPKAAASKVASAADRSDLKIVQTSLTALPPPDTPPPGNPPVRAFQTYALSQAELPPGVGKRTSAIVPTASELRADRAECGALPAAVFVDLDPGRGTFDPLAPGEADPALGPALAALRERGVRVVWFSRLGANFAGAARTALAQGGLDSAGADELMLMRDIDERKQSARDAVAKRVCPIAMLGDERADFDELYLYLKDPAAAVALDTMMGRGWFLASPFVRSSTAATR